MAVTITCPHCGGFNDVNATDCKWCHLDPSDDPDDEEDDESQDEDEDIGG